MAGFIYFMSNPACPNLLKIGKSKKDPTTDRVQKLNQTGVPEPFNVGCYAFVEDEDHLEKAVHRRFASQRPNKIREFFNVDRLKAISAIRQLAVILLSKTVCPRLKLFVTCIVLVARSTLHVLQTCGFDLRIA